MAKVKTCRRCGEVRNNEFTCEWCYATIENIVYCDDSYHHFCSGDCFTEAKRSDYENEQEFENEFVCAKTDIIVEETF